MIDSEWPSSCDAVEMFRTAISLRSACCGGMLLVGGVFVVAPHPRPCGKCASCVDVKNFKPWTGFGDREVRLFAAACARRDSGWADLRDPAVAAAVEAAEMFADGSLSVTRLTTENAKLHAKDVYPPYSSMVESLLLHSPSHRVEFALRTMGDDSTRLKLTADALRDIAGNIFNPVVLPADRRWLTDRVRFLAEDAYRHRPDGSGALSRLTLAALADAMEEDGCPPEVERSAQVSVVITPSPEGWRVHTFPAYGDPSFAYTNLRLEKVRKWAAEEYGVKRFCSSNRTRCESGLGVRKFKIPNEVLTHLRSPGPHFRGCRVVDLLTGRRS